jgi:hypothetical protein
MKRFLIVLVVFFFIFFLEGFAYYRFLSPESNMALELWKNQLAKSDYGYYYAIISDSNGTTSFLDPAPYEDVMAAPTDLEIGETWSGPSGQTYIAKAPVSTETGAEQINSALDTTLVPVKCKRWG